MPKKRTLTPKSLWDEAQVRSAFAEAGIKESHIPRIYRYFTI